MTKKKTLSLILIILFFTGVKAHAQMHHVPADSAGHAFCHHSGFGHSCTAHTTGNNTDKDSIEGYHNHCFCFFLRDTVDKGNNTVYIYNYTQGADSSMWYFGDGDSSRASFPKHTYANKRKYMLCLIIACNGGNYSWYCDSISDTGLNKYRSTQAAGFTLQIIPAGTGVTYIQPQPLKIYPNPVNNSLNISIPDGCPSGALSIKNAMGQALMQRTLINPGTNTLDISHLTEGIYFVQLTTPKGQYSTHIIKQ